ncbi:hypothetical protein ACGFZP_24950 [Kitasatospora sp. NPDC048239]|uniref:hypothetical protein n=1 Tax=Kitasatospora sp. NPDC048239 TaxID=3364046 RepID=UPI00371493FD
MSTPRPDSAPSTGAESDRTVRLGAAAAGAARTVRLGPVPAAEDLTVTLDQPVPAAGAPDTEATVRLDDAPAEPGQAGASAAAGTEAVSATFLDPRAWSGASDPAETATAVDPFATASGVVATSPGATRAPGASSASGSGTDPSADRFAEPFAPGELRRFGPGVPPQAAAVWHGAAVPDARRPRRVWRWLVPIVVLAAVLAFLYWRFTTPALAVTGVGVTTDPAGPGCGGTAVITAAVATNGGAGTIRYRWLRSDGTTSGEIAQEVPSGTHRTDLVLRWSFEGQGALQATATLDLLTPGPRTAAASFAYHCP